MSQARWPAGLAERPTTVLRVVVGLVLLGLAAAALALPSNLAAFPPVTRLAAVGVGAAISVSGMAVWERRPGNPIGPLLVLSGGLWILGRLQGVEGLPLALLANLANSLSQVVLLAVLLAFPTGRLPSRTAWAILVVGGTAIVAANLATATRSPTAAALGLDRPNPLYLPMDDGARQLLLGPLQLATYLAGLAALVWLVVRWGRASGPARRLILPVFLAGIAITLLVLGSQVLISTGALTEAQLTALVTVQLLSFALLPAAIAVQVIRDRMARGAVADLVVELGDTPRPERLQEALSSALRDPTLEIAHWSDERAAYLDAAGRPVALTATPGRAVTLLERDGRPLAAIVHDPALTDDPGLVTAIASAVRLAVENERLTAEVRSQLAEVRASRARIVEAGDAERRRVERNLHDGAQQRLVALSLALRRARAQLPEDAAPDAATTLDEASEQLREALAELRVLARGIHPAVLTEAGLAAALRSLARESTVPASVDLAIPDGLATGVEAAAYYVAAEALANVAKYAEAETVEIRASAEGPELRISVADDGRGGADPAAGSGLRGLADRVAALGGRLEIRSPIGGGTIVEASIPLAVLDRSG